MVVGDKHTLFTVGRAVLQLTKRHQFSARGKAEPSSGGEGKNGGISHIANIELGIILVITTRPSVTNRSTSGCNGIDKPNIESARSGVRRADAIAGEMAVVYAVTQTPLTTSFPLSGCGL